MMKGETEMSGKDAPIDMEELLEIITRERWKSPGCLISLILLPRVF